MWRLGPTATSEPELTAPRLVHMFQKLASTRFFLRIRRPPYPCLSA